MLLGYAQLAVGERREGEEWLTLRPPLSPPTETDRLRPALGRVLLRFRTIEHRPLHRIYQQPCAAQGSCRIARTAKLPM